MCGSAGLGSEAAPVSDRSQPKNRAGRRRNRQRNGKSRQSRGGWSRVLQVQGIWKEEEHGFVQRGVHFPHCRVIPFPAEIEVPVCPF